MPANIEKYRQCRERLSRELRETIRKVREDFGINPDRDNANWTMRRLDDLVDEVMFAFPESSSDTDKG